MRILVTITNSGADPGPYTITVLDAFDIVLSVTSHITKAQLTAGYVLTVPINAVKVKVNSESGRCEGYSQTILIPVQATENCNCTPT